MNQMNTNTYQAIKYNTKHYGLHAAHTAPAHVGSPRRVSCAGGHADVGGEARGIDA